MLSFKNICLSKIVYLFKFQSEVGFCFSFVLVQQQFSSPKKQAYCDMAIKKQYQDPKNL